jgi:glutathione synthase/RimK-type ligase-like ATP-grasp enzyme
MAANTHAQTLHQQLLDWFDMASALVVSRPAAMQASGSKPLQTQRIGEAGFLVPATLVSSDPDAVRCFHSQHGRVVFTSISDADSCVTELDDAGLSRMHGLAQLPTHFQAHVPGVDICVHVVGEQVFAAEATREVPSNSVLRRSGREIEWTVTTLPRAVAAQCVAMSQTMGLPLAGIDLRLRPDGAYVCFEVHPMPAYSAFEAQSGLPLAAALAELLQTA